jgi:hypothetical protein
LELWLTIAQFNGQAVAALAGTIILLIHVVLHHGDVFWPASREPSRNKSPGKKKNTASRGPDQDRSQ